MAETDSQRSEALRAQGNELYRQGKFTDALPLYEQADELAPDDPAPLSNVSVAHFELGDYKSAVTACDRALEHQKDEAKRQKILLRRATSQIHALELVHAGATIEQLADVKAKTDLMKCLASQSESRRRVQDTKAVHKMIIMDLPRFKPQMRVKSLSRETK
ncbi:hypothetical protein B0A55_09923 [Lecanosticta acicola]|uniref:Tetratricopeptide repeat protein n=1 Tax=Lecanosticta acicola TaxID=111012 RepID=A0AAI9E9V1_9PEZI|nr:hypothetical protein B0A55_09923 [Lecanosticta acicola]